MEIASDREQSSGVFGAARSAASTTHAACPPIEDAEIVAAAQAMNLAGLGAGGGAPLLAALLDDSADLGSLARRINAQPGIAVRLLRVANSSYYGQSGRVATIDHAARLLGLTSLRGIAAAACFDRMTAAVARGVAIDLPALRRHSLATACAAQALARHVAPSLSDLAFMAGLLHDLGVIVQWRLRPQWLVPVKALPLPGDAPTALNSQHEVLRLGATHAHCGQVLLDTWHLPPSLGLAVASHDAEVNARCSDGDIALPTGLLKLADRLAWDAGFGFANDNPPEDALEPAPFSLTLEQLESLRSTLVDTVKRLSGVFHD
jgi:HD-like signal output (HDOD) protein